MKRNIDLSDISDGRLYDLSDMVKADCDGCDGCSKCCRGMGSSIVLDPYDIYNMTYITQMEFQELIAAAAIEMNVVDGIILPNISMTSGKCYFLNGEGRCSIHSHRPGICRLFPLGRIYANGDFKFFVQTNECEKKKLGKIKVEKWLGIPEAKKNKEFINTWHNIINEVENILNSNNDDEFRKNLNMFVLSTFYMTKYNCEVDFYQQFEKRIERFRQIVTV